MEPKKSGRITKFIVMLANNLRWVIVGYLLAILGGGVLFYFLEGQARGLTLLDTVYWADITASTVGYGDISPTSALSKIMTIAYLKLTVFFVAPLVIVNIYNKVQRDAHKYTDEEQDWDEEAIKLIAAKLGVELPPSPRDTDYED